MSIPPELQFACLCIGGALILCLVIWVLMAVDDEEKKRK